ncbi:unnamed protein product [Adineta steineri]|uniref:CRAL/TRIO N-terminal domain-containing protein n=1 Tax=Adineta steineri TaxID=433720 RepID=A0A813MDR3_9BILA|nr:unnamed protein product [Adineta steineri]
MTSNDLGHINNLGRAHTNALKKTWRSLIEAISKETSLSGKYIADSVYVDELFRAMGYDNPDVLILRWLRSRKWDVNASVHQMIETMKWRRDWGVQELVAKGERARCLMKKEKMRRESINAGICNMSKIENLIL